MKKLLPLSSPYLLATQLRGTGVCCSQRVMFSDLTWYLLTEVCWDMLILGKIFKERLIL